MSHHCKISFLLGLFLSLGLAGCWDAEEIETKTFTSGLALDFDAEGQVKLTAQIPIPELMLPAASHPGPAKNFYMITAQGRTSLEALDRLSTKTPGTLGTIQTKVIIINQQIAQEKPITLLDPFVRMNIFPANTFLLVTKEDAGQLLGQTLSSHILPSFYLVGIFQKANKQEFVYPMPFWQFLARIDDPGIDPYLPLITYEQEEKVYLLAGLGVFSGQRLVSFLSPEEAKIFGLLSAKQGDIMLSFPWRENRRVAVRHLRSRAKLRWEDSNTISILLNITGYLMEETGATIPLTPALLQEMEDKFAGNIKNEAEALLQSLQAVNSDPLGLGRFARWHLPGKISEQEWRTLYPTLPLKVEVRFTFTSTGLVR